MNPSLSSSDDPSRASPSFSPLSLMEEPLNDSLLPPSPSVRKKLTNCLNSNLSHDRIQRIVDFLKNFTSYLPEFGIICGSGLSNLSAILQDKHTIKYCDIPEFPQSTVDGHQGELVFGKLQNATVVCMKGRFHTYEGFEIQTTTLPVRIMALLGVQVLVVTNAAGALNPSYHVGDIMFISDHFNLPGLAGKHPLVGPNDNRFGQRFIPLTKCYDARIRNAAYRSAKKLGIQHKVHTKGVYSYVSGPSYETPAECHLLRLLGSDAVGMSTVPEVIVAIHSGLKVFAVSLITNLAVFPNSNRHVNPPTHQEVLDEGHKAAKDIQQLLIKVIEDLSHRKEDIEYLKDRGLRVIRRKESNLPEEKEVYHWKDTNDEYYDTEETEEETNGAIVPSALWKNLFVGGCLFCMGLTVCLTRRKL